MDYVKVVIVGGGAAGLGAARTLGSKVDYLLIEAQDYLGGRIHTVDAAPNVTVDLGAQFIHGETKNIVHEICKQLDCIMPDKTNAIENMLIITSEGTTVDSQLFAEVVAIWEQILCDARAKFGDRTVPADVPLADFVLKNFRERLAILLPSSSTLVDALVEYFNKVELIENGCLALSDLSLAEYGSFEYLNGSYEYELKSGGYRPLINYLKSSIPNENQIRFNSEVIRVKYLNENHQLRVEIRQTNADEQQTSTITCDHLIWTTSLGFLKANFHSIFADERTLIAQKTDAIANLGFDTVNKVVMVYDKRILPDNVESILRLHMQNDRPLDLSESLKSRLRTENIDIQTAHFIIESIHRYDVLSSTNVPVLICWFGGQAALTIEDFSEQTIGQLCHETLCTLLNVNNESYRLMHLVKSGWHKNRFIRGSYSYYSIRSSRQDGDRLRAAYTPDGIPRILFAGEATHERFYSTVHGALESGIHAAQTVLCIMNNN